MFRIAWLTIPLLIFTASAHATLGQASSSITQDMRQLSASPSAHLKSLNKNGVQVSAFSVPGATVREHVNSANRVFAITWNGFTHPNLKVLLGSYYDEYLKARSQKLHHGHGARRIVTPNIVVEFGGHMRAFVGKAYLPAQVPSGVDVGHL